MTLIMESVAIFVVYLFNFIFLFNYFNQFLNDIKRMVNNWLNPVRFRNKVLDKLEMEKSSNDRFKKFFALFDIILMRSLYLFFIRQY